MEFTFKTSTIPPLTDLTVENDRLMFRQAGDEVEIALCEIPSLIKALATILDLCPHALNSSTLPPGSYERARGVLGR